ncbi:MAG: DUF1329 domain-containing protein [Nevskia sp.]|nr:DUF1329 domain-containing protein [Nevskia sp.]
MRVGTASVTAAVLLLVLPHVAFAKVSAQEAAKLGKELTPMGSERAGNKDGTIPEWKPAAQRGSLTGEFSTNPEIDGEKPLFTITRANLAQYVERLDAGHKHLFELYPTYKMNVYPSHRFVNYPDAVLKATIANATTAELQGVDVLTNATLGFPFPIPKSGAEVVWNHRLRYAGDGIRRFNNQMIVQPSGEYVLTKIVEEAKFYYGAIKNPVQAGPGSVMIKIASQTLAPPRLAGTLIIAHERDGSRDAWLYSPGIKRIRRAPTVCCDNPYEGTDGMEFYDQVAMFNGTLERYDWKLLGKREMYIAYDSSKISGNTIKFKDLAHANHLNQDLPRYELHRIWVVEGDLRPGTNHTFNRRVFYVDEDSWSIVASEDYDAHGQLYEYQEGHLQIGYNVLSAGTSPEVIYHFDSGRYFITAMANEDKPVDFSVHFDDSYFEPQGMEARQRR